MAKLKKFCLTGLLEVSPVRRIFEICASLNIQDYFKVTDLHYFENCITRIAQNRHLIFYLKYEGRAYSVGSF